MKLIIREFLGQLKESGELDRLLPDLLARMKLIPISKPQVGVRQNGVDVAAVGKDGKGVKSLYLFVLKVGDLGRSGWDNGVNAVRPTLSQVKDSYRQSFVQSEHKELPVKIVVCTTGDLKQEVAQDFKGYTENNTEENLSFEFWSGDKLATLIDEHLLDEYAINPSERANLRRAIALIGTPDYDLRHAHELFRGLLLENMPEEGKNLSGPERKRFIRQLKTSALALNIIFHWAAEEGNLLNALLAGERCCLWAWEGIRARGLLNNKAVISAFDEIYGLFMQVCNAYFVKLQPYCHVRDAVSGYESESSLVANKVYEQIGLLSVIGILQLQSMLGSDDKGAAHNAAVAAVAAVAADAVIALIKNNPGSGSPRFDGHAIEISLAMLLLYSTGKYEEAKNWLMEISRRLPYCFQRLKSFPIATDSLDDLVDLDSGALDDEGVKKLRDLSTLIPTIMYWCAVLEYEDLYRQLQAAQDSVFEGICQQLWYPDEATDGYIYRGPAQFESGTTEAPIKFPPDITDLISANRQLLEGKTVPDLSFSSAVQHGLFGLTLMACRHFRTPFPPQFWLPLLSRIYADAGNGDVSVGALSS